MIRRGIVLTVIALAVLGVGGVWLATPACACTPALPATPDTITSLGELAGKIAASQERYRLSHAGYAATLNDLDLPPIAPELIVESIQSTSVDYSAQLKRLGSPVQSCRMVSITSAAPDSTRFRLDCRDGPP